MATPPIPPAKLKKPHSKYYTHLVALKTVQSMAAQNHENWIDTLGEAG
jgi:hypothetical protein